MPRTNLFLTILSVAAVAAAQTTAELDAMRQSLNTIQQDAADLRTLIDSTVLPAGWRQSVVVTSDRIKATAAAVGDTAKTVAADTGQTILVPAGGSIPTALQTAVPGDTIVLQAGAVYKGGFVLPAKSGTGFITITTSAASSLPQGRIGPQHAALMPRIVGINGGAVIGTAPGAHHYRLVGLNLEAAPNVYAGAILQIGNGYETTEAQLPTDIEIDRVWIHAEAPAYGKRGAMLQGKRVTLQNSRVSGIRSTWQETQAVAFWNTPGPVQLLNNHLEAAGMALLVGGAEPPIAGVTPSDILIAGNLMTRPLAWRTESLVVKNNMELKTGRRVTITGNIMENTWTAAHSGYAVNIKPGPENVKTPAITQDILFENNIIRRATGGLVITGTNSVGGAVSKVTIRNNFFDDLGPNWGYRHNLFGMFNGVTDVVIENNTATPTVLLNAVIMADGQPQTTGLVFRGNVSERGSYGVFGSGRGEGLKCLSAYFPGALFTNNMLYNSASTVTALYPTGNYFPATSSEVGWAAPASGDYRLLSTSTYALTGIDGRAPGVDFTALAAATARAATGQ